MPDTWTILKENSSLNFGDAWEHLNAQEGGGPIIGIGQVVSNLDGTAITEEDEYTGQLEMVDEIIGKIEEIDDFPGVVQEENDLVGDIPGIITIEGEVEND